VFPAKPCIVNTLRATTQFRDQLALHPTARSTNEFVIGRIATIRSRVASSLEKIS